MKKRSLVTENMVVCNRVIRKPVAGKKTGNWLSGRKKVMGQALAAVVMAGLLLTGCGSSKGYSYESADTAAAEPAMAQESYDSGGGYLVGDGVDTNAVTEEIAEAKSELAEFDEAVAEEGGAAETPQVQKTTRKLIRNVDLEVETETFDDLLTAVRRRTELMEGYIEESYTYNGSSYSGNRLRNANLTIRVPAEHLDEFLENMAEVSNVISRNESVTDVTLRYVDLESHKKVLLAEQERLLALLEKAETIEDIISLEQRLSEVRYQLESMESQLRVMDNQVSYSTVYLYINEVVKLTPVKEQSVWEKISTGFVNSLYDVGNALADFGIGFVIDLPYIFVWALIIILAIVIFRWILKRVRRKNPEKKERISLKERLRRGLRIEESTSKKEKGE